MRVKVFALLAAAVLAVAACGGGGSGKASANQLEWGKPVFVMGQPGSEFQVSCPTTTFCAVVSGSQASTFDGSAWTKPVGVGSRTSLVALSCPNSSFCIALDSSGDSFVFNGRSWAGAAGVEPLLSGGSIRTQLVSCSSSSFCVAVDNTGGAFVWNGTKWGEKTAGVDAPSGQVAGFLALSCPTASFCAVVSTVGELATFDGKQWSKPKLVDKKAHAANVASGPVDNGVALVSCPQVESCVAIVGAGNSFVYNGKSTQDLSTVSPGPTGSTHTSASCPTINFCVAVGTETDGSTRSGTSNSFDGTQWSGVHTGLDKFGGGLVTVACPNTLFCVAFDGNGNALVYS